MARCQAIVASLLLALASVQGNTLGGSFTLTLLGPPVSSSLPSLHKGGT